VSKLFLTDLWVAQDNLEMVSGIVASMDAFGSNLDGFYDVENQLPRYLRERATEHFEAERDRKDRIDSVADAERHADEQRRAFLDALGGLPDESTPLHTERTGGFERDGYAVETIVFESLPDFHVTGNLYRPRGTGPFPGILFLCGHSDTGKGSSVYQRACIELARNGFVAFAIDPIGQGERVQSYDPESGEIRRQSIHEHTYLAQQCLVAGGNLSRYFVWDMIRALDYLEGRPDVDESRLGATGNSGGGMQTGFLMLVDDRLDAAAPSCFVTSREAYMKTGQAQDGEQVIAQAIERGPNYDDFIAAFAPDPVLVCSAQSDFLCIEGSRQSVERAKGIYELYDAAENIDLAVADDTHGFSPPLRERMINWFRVHLRDIEPTFEVGEPSVEPVSRIHCTEAGQVHGEYADETHVIDLNRQFLARRTDDPGSVPDVTDHDAYAAEMRKRVIDRFGLNRERCEHYPRRIRIETDEARNVRWEKVFFYSEPDLIVAGILAEALNPPEQYQPTVVLPEHGTADFTVHEDRIAARARDRGVAMAFDPRGVGAVRARDVNTRLANGGEYFEYHGTEYKLASDAIMLGESLFGGRVFDVLRAREYLANRYDDGDTASGIDGYGVEGVGVGGLYAVVAATAEPTFRSVRAEEVDQTFYDVATQYEYDIDFRHRVHGVAGICDVPQLLPALSDRNLSLDGHAFNGLR